MMRKKKNIWGFSSAMLPQRTKLSVRRRARKASYAPGFLGAKSRKEELETLRLMREIARMGQRERNTVAKKNKSRKRRQPAALAKYWAERSKKTAVKRRQQNARPRKPVVRRRVVSCTRNRRPAQRRNVQKHVHLGISLSRKQKRKLARALSAITGKRVHVQ